MIVKPAKSGLVIRDPFTKRALADEGGRVPDTSFWRRRIADGDVVLVEERDEPTGLEPVTPLTTRREGDGR